MTVIGADVLEIPSAFTGDWEVSMMMEMIVMCVTYWQGLQVLSIFIAPLLHTQLDGFISLPLTSDLTELTLQLVRGVHYSLHGKDAKDNSFGGGGGLDAIIVASGGWSPDPKPIKTDRSEQTLEDNAMQYCATIEDMRRKNLDPCLACGFIAQYFMNHDGLYVVMGATAALQPTPGMLGYGLAKTAAHFHVQTLGACTRQSLNHKSIRQQGAKARQGLTMESLSVVGVFPTTNDTAAQRPAFPPGDYSEWGRPSDISKEIGSWVNEPALRPHSGSLVKVRPSEQQQGASFELVR